MGAEKRKTSIRNSGQEKLKAPPGFVSLTSFNLKRVKKIENTRLSADLLSDYEAGLTQKLEKSFKQRPWIIYDQEIHGPEESEHERVETMGHRPATSSGHGHGDASGGRGSGDPTPRFRNQASGSKTQSQHPALDPVQSSTPQSVRNHSSFTQSSNSGHVPPSPEVPPAPAAQPPRPAATVAGLPEAGKLFIKVVQADRTVFPVFYPSASRKISKTFKKRQDVDGTAWKTIPETVKETYWKQFEKACCWAPGTDTTVRAAWDRIAARRYSDWQSKLKKKNIRPTWCSHEVWAAWTAHWGTAAAREKAAIKAANRRGKSGNPFSVHIGGSKSHLEHAMEVCNQEGSMPSLLRQFRTMHQRDDGSFCDVKSTLINEKLEERKSQLEAELKSAGLPVVIDENQLLLDVLAELGGLDKGRVYGIGNRASSLGKNGPYAVETSTPPVMTTEETMELIQRLVRESVRQSIDITLKQSIPDIVKAVRNHLGASTTWRGTTNPTSGRLVQN